MPKEKVELNLEQAIPDFGKATMVTEYKTFPLQSLHAKPYYDNNVVLIGDAAHVVHPMAGQGLNLGIQDALSLSKVIKQGLSLSKYKESRVLHNTSMQQRANPIKQAIFN